MKKELKKQNPHLNFGFVDILSHFDPTETNKFLPLLMGELKKALVESIILKDPKQMEEMRYYINRVSAITTYEDEDLQRMPVHLLNMMKEYHDWMINNSGLTTNIKDLLGRFEELCGKNLIKDKDIQNYKSLAELEKAVKDGDFSEVMKNNTLKKQVVFENDAWIIIRPLTYEASVKYGYGTKWCTAMVNEKEYFYRYTKNHFLVYLFDKENKRKYGIQGTIGQEKNNNERTVSSIAIFDETDVQIDSYRAKISPTIMDMLFNISMMHNTNYEYMLEYEPECANLVDEFYNNNYQNKSIGEAAMPLAAAPYHDPDPVQNDMVGEIDGVEYEKKASYQSLDVIQDEFDRVVDELKLRRKFDIFSVFRKYKKLVIFYIPVDDIGEIHHIREKFTEALQEANTNAIFLPAYDNIVRHVII